jgi:hypothetical protein
MDHSRDTFYRYQQLVAEGGVENLIEKTIWLRNNLERFSKRQRGSCEGIFVFRPYFI